jgi:prevent-host-death family protein
MSSINITNGRKNLYRIVDSVNESHEPIHITGKKNSAVLVGEDDWKSIEETLYLSSIPGMRESIIDDMKTPIEKLESDLDW